MIKRAFDKVRLVCKLYPSLNRKAFQIVSPALVSYLALELLWTALCRAALEDYPEVTAGSKCDGVSTNGCFSICPCATTAMWASLIGSWLLSAIQNAGYTYKAPYGREHGYLKNSLLPIVSTQPVYSGRVDISGSPVLNIVTFSVAILIHRNNINAAPSPHWKGCICPVGVLEGFENLILILGLSLWFVVCDWFDFALYKILPN